MSKKNKKIKNALAIAAGLAASNYLGKRAGEGDAALNAAKRITGMGDYEKPSLFGASTSAEKRVKSKLSFSRGGKISIQGTKFTGVK